MVYTELTSSADRREVMAAVLDYGCALAGAAREFKADPGIVLAAVKQVGSPRAAASARAAAGADSRGRQDSCLATHAKPRVWQQRAASTHEPLHAAQRQRQEDTGRSPERTRDTGQSGAQTGPGAALITSAPSISTLPAMHTSP